MKSRISPPKAFFQGKALLLLCCAGLVLMVLIVFGKSVRCGFLNFDDPKYITCNAHVLRGLTWDNLWWSISAGLKSGEVDTDNWMPLTLLSHMVVVHGFGLQAGAHHALNIILHAVGSVLLFLVLRSMTGAIWRSFFVAALFAIHPLHVESVAWVAERKDVLSGLFFMLTLGAYLGYTRKRSIGRYSLVILCFFLGLMSKPMLVTLPFLLLLLDYWPLQRMGRVGLGTLPTSGLIAEKIPLLALSVLDCMATLAAQGSYMGQSTLHPLPERMINAVVAYVRYLGKTFWPTGLSAHYPLLPQGSWPQGEIVTSFLLLLLITLIALRCYQSHPYLLVGWLWYLGMLVPVIGIIQVGNQAFADRYTYLPLIGIFLALTWLAADLAKGIKVPIPLTGFVASLLLLMLMLVARHQVSFWKNDLDLWTQCLSLNHSNPIALNNMGLALAGAGRDDEALALFEEACRLEPDYSTARLNIAMEQMRHGNSREASSELLNVIHDNPRDEKAYYNLSILSQQEGRKSDAMTSLREALKINPSFGEASLSLAALLIESGTPNEAVAVLRSSLQYHPGDAVAHAHLGEALSRQGQWQESLVEYGRAVSLKPDNPESLAGLGSSLLATGRVMDAVPPLSRATQLNPKLADAHNNLGIALIRTNRRNEAVKEFEMAISLDPANPNFLRNLNYAKGGSSDHPTDNVIK